MNSDKNTLTIFLIYKNTTDILNVGNVFITQLFTMLRLNSTFLNRYRFC